jgi:hypothetical protein
MQLNEQAGYGVAERITFIHTYDMSRMTENKTTLKCKCASVV